MAAGIASAAVAAPYQFKILVDVNQLTPKAAAQAQLFAADGVWAITHNSPPGIDWAATLAALNAKSWTVSEDDPGRTHEVDAVSAAIHRLVDAAMFYNEDGLATPLSDAQIAAYASHVVPQYGRLGNRIVVLTRSYGKGDRRRTQLDHALRNPMVSGATFEFSPLRYRPARELEDVGCEHILQLGKKCYLLVPDGGTKDYIGDLRKVMSYFGRRAGLLENPNFYIVLAAYSRPGTVTVHFLNERPSDRNSVEAAVAWLKAFRASRG